MSIYSYMYIYIYRHFYGHIGSYIILQYQRICHVRSPSAFVFIASLVRCSEKLTKDVALNQPRFDPSLVHRFPPSSVSCRAWSRPIP